MGMKSISGSTFCWLCAASKSQLQREAGIGRGYLQLLCGPPRKNCGAMVGSRMLNEIVGFQPCLGGLFSHSFLIAGFSICGAGASGSASISRQAGTNLLSACI